MGLFDKFLKKPENNDFTYVPSSEHEAWVGILYACMTADGEADGAETLAIGTMLAFKQKFLGVDVVPLLNNVGHAINKLGGLGVVAACSKKIDPNDKDTIFTMGVEVVLADGTLNQDEVTVIEAVANELGMTADKVAKIIEVMLIRNKGNLVI